MLKYPLAADDLTIPWSFDKDPSTVLDEGIEFLDNGFLPSFRSCWMVYCLLVCLWFSFVVGIEDFRN